MSFAAVTDPLVFLWSLLLALTGASVAIALAHRIPMLPAGPWRRAWIGLLAITGGTTAWSTHVLALRGVTGGTATALHGGWLLVGWAMAVVASGAGVVAWTAARPHPTAQDDGGTVRRRRAWLALVGVCAVVTIVGVDAVTVQAAQVPGSGGVVRLSVGGALLAWVLTIAAGHLAHGATRRARALSVALLALALVGADLELLRFGPVLLHPTAAGGVVSIETLAAWSTVGMLLIMAAGVGAMSVHRRWRTRVAMQDALAQLREREALFRAAFDEAGTPMLLVDPDGGHIRRVNAAAVAYFGRSSTALEATTVVALAHPEDQAGTVTRFAHAHRTQSGGKRVEHRFVHGDGRVLWGVVQAHRVQQADGAVLHVVQVQDTTEQHAAAAVLATRHAQLAGLVALQQAMATVDIRSDDAMQVMLGHLSAVTGADGAALMLAEDVRFLCVAGTGTVRPLVGEQFPMADNIAASAWTAQRIVIEERHGEAAVPVLMARTATRSAIAAPLHYQGEAIGVVLLVARRPAAFGDAVTQSLAVSAGMLAGAFSHARELERRQQALTTLEARERRFRALIENAADAVLVLDAEARPLYASPAIERLFGYAPDELADQPAFAHVHPEDLPRVRERFAALCAHEGATHAEELRGRRKDGTWATLLVVTTNRLTDPSVHGVVLNVRDLSAYAEVTAQLRQAQRMESVGRLAGGVAHDFNNLLTVMRCNVEFLAHKTAADDPRQKELDEIRKAATRAAELTRQLLAFSRKQVLQPRPVQLGAIVAGVEPMLRRLLPEDVRLVVNAAPLAHVVQADPGQLEQVVLNLALNARDAMPQGGTLAIAVSELEVQTATVGARGLPPGRYQRLTVRDTGTGMDDATQARIFEPFFTTKEVGDGTGLGLSMVYGIVQQSGGTIWCDTILGQGTVFTLFLPAVEGAPVVPVGDADGASIAGGTECILLVEDDVLVRDVTSRALRKHGYEVHEAEDATAAIAACGTLGHRIDLVVTDVVMPGMNGRELAAHMRGHRPGLRVLFMSGYTGDEVFRRALLDPKATPYLQKPFTIEALLAKVRLALDDTPEVARSA